MPDRTEYKKITTYEQAFEQVLGMRFDDKLKSFVKALEKDGHTEKSISFAIWRTKDTLRECLPISDITFFGFLEVLRNEICKYSWTKDDPRWTDYKKHRERETIINEYMDKLNTSDFMYFMQGENGGSIRIGYSIHPVKTLKSLQNGYPDTLKILVVIPEYHYEVMNLEKRFEKYKTKGNWYKPAKEILDVIEELKIKYEQVGDLND